MSATTTIDQQLPELMRHFEVALRSGYNLRQAFGILAQDLPQPIADDAKQIADALDNEAPYSPPWMAGCNAPPAMTWTCSLPPSRYS